MITDKKSFTRKEKKYIKSASSQATVGSECRPNNPLVMQFGCNCCSWRDTPMCPHGLTGLERHANHICSHRVKYVREMTQLANSQTRIFQVEHLVQLKLMMDKMMMDYNEGLLDKQFSSISKNMISLIDKMRRQDEGLKIQGEISHTVQDFRKIVDTQAELVKGKDIVKEAEFFENANKSDNKKGNGTTSEKV